MTLKMTVLLLTLLNARAFAAEVSTATAKTPAKAPAAPAASALKTDEDKILYALGAALGRNLAPLNLTSAELKAVTAGCKDAAAGNKLQVELQSYGPKIEGWAQARQAKKAEGEKKKARDFQDKMAKEPGAVVSPTGLIYIEQRPGTGAMPASSDTVKAHYEGTLLDGTVFDSSYRRGEPTEFALNHVIRCWTEALTKMKVGGKAKLICPSDIAYGDGGNGSIPPGATLVFTVELVDIVKK